MAIWRLSAAAATLMTAQAAPSMVGGHNEAVVLPFKLSDVALQGDWKDKEFRNQEVLMGLNFSKWACLFTTTANLTSCKDEAAPWFTYNKSARAPTGYEEKDGFLGLGNDVQPGANATIEACLAFCTKTDTCKAVTFQSHSNASTAEVYCYWKLSASGFTPQKSHCITAGADGAPECAPLPGEMGLGGYYGHYQGHWMSATAFLYNTTGNVTIKAVAARNIATLAKVMDAWKTKYGYDGYLFPYDPLVWDKFLAIDVIRLICQVPFYTLHKLMAGLIDQYDYAGNTQAYELVTKMADWVHDRVEAVIASDGGMKLWQTVLHTEWGGMNDVLFNIFDHTGEERHLLTARRFNAYVFTAPLAVGVDDLNKQPFPHANFHLPEVVGMARAYEMTGNATDKAIVDTFLSVLTANHSYATGGSNSGECWQAPRDLGNFLDDQTEESCTQYNLLKIARRSFLTSASAERADLYERAILNGIIGNQNRDDTTGTTSYIYMQPLGGANVKPWGVSDYGFPCCWGTLSESFAKLGDSIFFWGKVKPELYINQFVSATVQLGRLPGTVSVEQVAHFPVDPHKTTTLTIHGDGNFTLKLRVPGWATSGRNVVTVNGKAVLKTALAPGNYLSIDGPFKDGDVVEASFPMSLWTDPLNDYHADHNATLAFMYGPLVLTGVHLDSDVWVPKGGTAGAKADPAGFITRNSTTALDFEATAADGTKIQMIPLNEVMSEKYVAYFMTAGTKPPMPKKKYCPHSARSDYPYLPTPIDMDPPISRGQPMPAPRPGPPPPPPSSTRARIAASTGRSSMVSCRRSSELLSTSARAYSMI